MLRSVHSSPQERKTTLYSHQSLPGLSVSRSRNQGLITSMTHFNSARHLIKEES
jgi:hypothetical protein